MHRATPLYCSAVGVARFRQYPVVSGNADVHVDANVDVSG